MIKLMYITNNPQVASVAENNGVDRIFIDMEFIGKSERQGGKDTVQNHHTVSDIENVKKVLKTSQIMCRVNPIHEKTDNYYSSKEEIELAINAGADILMLPYFKSVEEVEKFIDLVNGRAKTMPLVETPQSVAVIDDILKLKGLDEIFIGLNDLSLGFGMKFMFELLSDGIVENLCNKFKEKNIPYGFGGIAGLGQGMLPSEHVIKEHYRLGSTCAILSRSFCNWEKIKDLNKIEEIFRDGIKEIRDLETECQKHLDYFSSNQKEVHKKVSQICGA